MTSRSFAWSCVVSVLVLCTGPIAASEEEKAATPPPEAAAAEAPDPARPTWYAQALAQGPGGLNVTHFWSKGSLLRAETVIAGRKVVTLVNGDWYSAYDATKGLGIRVRRTPEATAKDAAYHRPFGNEAVKLIEQGAEKIREENYHGRDVEIYQLTDRLGRRMVWVSKEALNIPLRIELYNRRTGSRQATDYTDWLTGLTMSDAWFEIDPGVEVRSYEFDEYVEFSSQTGGMGPVPVLYMDLLRGR
jgi:hypothetical protein